MGVGTVLYLRYGSNVGCGKFVEIFFCWIFGGGEVRVEWALVLIFVK